MPTGTITPVAVHASERPSFFLKTLDGGKMYHVAFCEAIPLHAIPVGPIVIVAYDNSQEGILYSCTAPTISSTTREVEEAEGSKRRHRRVLQGNIMMTPTEPRILIYIVTMCGFNSPPAASLQVSRVNRTQQ